MHHVQNITDNTVAVFQIYGKEIKEKVDQKWNPLRNTAKKVTT